MKSPTYRIRQLTKYYDDRCVLEIPELDIIDGEAIALVGPSGSGKSTLLRLLNFLEPPTSGTIEFQNYQFRMDVEMPLEIKRRVTTVFQRPVLLNQTVISNVTYGLRLRGRKDSSIAILSVLERVGLGKLAQQGARTLSGGEAQRVALARAMVLRPDVLLLDEPTANLDPYNVGLIEDIVKKLNQDYGTTLVLVTHNVFQAHRIAHRVAFLLDGKLVELSDTEDFFNSPKDPRTAAFIRGDMVY
jgi:tungstate transport system ATP-binding protein